MPKKVEFAPCPRDAIIWFCDVRFVKGWLPTKIFHLLVDPQYVNLFFADVNLLGSLAAASLAETGLSFSCQDEVQARIVLHVGGGQQGA